MDELKCPNCGIINSAEVKQCICGHAFDQRLNDQSSEYKQIMEEKQTKINFFKKNQIGIIVFTAFLGLRFIWMIQKTHSFEEIAGVFFAIILDSPIALLLAVLIQWIWNVIKKKK